MQYYYSLLESYQQLKQRKFKLSLREEGEAPEGQDPAAVIAQLGKGMTRDNPGVQNGVAVYDANASIAPAEGEATPESGHDVETFIGMWEEGGMAATLMVGGEVNPKGSKLADQMIAKLMGGEGEGGEEGTGVDETQSKIASIGKEIKDKISELLGMNAFEGLNLDKKHLRRPETLANLAMGKAQGFAGSLEDMESRVLNSGNVSDEDKLITLQTLQNALSSFKTYREKGEFDEGEAKKLGKVLSSMKTTSDGVLINGVALFFRPGSNVKTDALRNLAEQLNDAASKYNKQWEDLEPDLKKEAVIPQLTAAAESSRATGADESYRGIVAEKTMLASKAMFNAEKAWEKATSKKDKLNVLKKMHGELSKLKNAAIGDKGMDKMVEVFGIGRGVALGELIANRDQMSYAQFAIDAQARLEDTGMSPEKADAWIKSCGEGDGVAMSLLTISMINQSMDRELFGDDPNLIPDNIEHAGDDDSASSGRKADLIFKWDSPEACKKIASHYAKKLGGGATKSGCGGEDSGIDNILQKGEDGSCQMQVELKTLTSTKSKKGAGELSPSRSTAICSNAPVVADYDKKVLAGSIGASDGMTQATRDFSVKNTERLNNCGGEGAAKRGCEKSKHIDSRVKVYTNLLTPGSNNPGPTPEQSHELLDRWWAGKSQTDDRQTARYKGAQRIIDGTSTSDQLKGDQTAMKNIHRDMQQLVFKDELTKAVDSKGNVTDEGWRDYLLMNYSQATASTEETLRVSRGLSDNDQSMYLNNATVEYNMNLVKNEEAHFVYEGGGTINLVDNDGNILAGNDTSRGISKWTVGKGTSKHQEQIAKKDESLMLSFLQGQAELIEKLIDQTT